MKPSSITVILDEPPSLNEMISLAKQRLRIGGRSVPLVYDRAKGAYEVKALADLRLQGHFPPREPWVRWRIKAAEFRLRNLRDPVELFASLKFVVDALVVGRYVVDDGPHNLLSIPLPTQRIDRANRGVTLTISQVEP